MFFALKLILLIAAAGGGYYYGWESRGWKEDAARYDTAVAYAEAIRTEQARADAIANDAEQRLRILRARAKTVEKETAHEIEKPDYRCALPVSGRLLLRADVRAANAARTAAVADTAPATD